MTSMKLAMLVISTLRLVNGHGVLTWPPNRQQLGEECFKVENCFQANRVVTKSHQDDFHGCCDDDCSYVLWLVVVMAMMKKKKKSIPHLKWVTYTTFVPSEGGSTQEPFLMDKEAVFVCFCQMFWSSVQLYRRINTSIIRGLDAYISEHAFRGFWTRVCHLFEPHPERLFFGGHGGVFIVWIKAEYVSGIQSRKKSAQYLA